MNLVASNDFFFYNSSNSRTNGSKIKYIKKHLYGVWRHITQTCK